jgi:hypothetical protein
MERGHSPAEATGLLAAGRRTRPLADWLVVAAGWNADTPRRRRPACSRRAAGLGHVPTEQHYNYASGELEEDRETWERPG